MIDDNIVDVVPDLESDDESLPDLERRVNDSDSEDEGSIESIPDLERQVAESDSDDDSIFTLSRVPMGFDFDEDSDSDSEDGSLPGLVHRGAKHHPTMEFDCAEDSDGEDSDLESLPCL